MTFLPKVPIRPNIFDASEIQPPITAHPIIETWPASTAAISNLTIAGDSTTNATISSGQVRYETLETDDDTDWFQIQVSAYQSFSVYLFGYDHNLTNGLGALTDCYITIYDSNGAVVATTDPNSANANYYGVTYSYVDFTALQSGTYFVEASSSTQGGVGDYGLAIAAVDPADGTPGDITTTATISDGDLLYATIDYPGDTDWYQLDLETNQAISLVLFGYDHDAGNSFAALSDCNITIYDSAGNAVAYTDPAMKNADYYGIVWSYMEFTAGAAGTYYVEVSDTLQDGVGDYGLLAAAPVPLDPIPGDGTTVESISVNDIRYETLETDGDTDWFRLNLSNMESVSLILFGYDHDTSNGIGALSDCKITIYDSAGNVLSSSDQATENSVYYGITWSGLDFTAPSSGTYFVEVSTTQNIGVGDYGLMIAANDSTSLPVDANLIVGQYETGNYGNGFSGTSDSDGIVSFTFDSPGSDIQIYVDGYDIDTSTEVELLLNGQSIGYLSRSENLAYQGTVFSISASLLLSGQNTIQFVQTSLPTYVWGVTDIIVMGEGLHVSPITIDPEFSEDGYVVWQTDRQFFLGTIDPETGAVRDIVNQVNIGPTNIRITQQGPEIIRTSTDGIGAIGVSPNGLVHYTEDQATILAGTAGLKIGYMPKGETPGLRFTAHDEFNNVYLYDNGTLTLLDFGGGIVTSWLNESEFVVSYRSVGIEQIGIYDLDTGIMTIIAQESYGSPAQQAAFTASDGVQYLALTDWGTSHDIWRNDGSGWEIYTQISCPIPGLAYFYSPEFFEWQGHIFIVGVASTATGIQYSAPALYDMDSDTWYQPGAQQNIQGSIADPEIMVLDNDTIAYYYSDISDPGNFVEYFFTATYDEILETEVPIQAGSVLSVSEASDTFVFDEEACDEAATECIGFDCLDPEDSFTDVGDLCLDDALADSFVLTEVEATPGIDDQVYSDTILDS